MIKINSLSIGNYVYYNNEHNEIGVITEIKTSINPNIDYIGLNNRVDIYYQLKHIKGIPLTEEWLFKFDFKLIIESSNISKWFIGYNPITHDYLFIITQFIDENRFFFKNGFHTIKHIHELQNLYFALTGEELTLNK